MELTYIIIGGVIGYFGAYLKHILELSSKRKSELRIEKLKIYSNVLKENGALFINADTYKEEVSKPDYLFQFSNKLARTLAPARLIANSEVEEQIRIVYEKEMAWHTCMAENRNTEIKPKEKKKKEAKLEKLAGEATKARITLEKEMRKEIQKM